LKIFIKAYLICCFFVRHLALFMQSLKHFTLPKFYASVHKKTPTPLSSEKTYRRSNFAQSGFSVFELMVVVLIFALIVTMAFPLSTQQLMRLEQRRVHYIWMGILNQSKLTALSLRQAVVICGATSSITCNGDFNRGLLAFVDDNRNRQRDPHEKILGFEPLALKYGRLRWRGAGGRSYILFQRINGMPIGSNGSLIYCSDDPKYHVQLILSHIGLIRIRDLNQDGVLENASGGQIDCG